MPQVPNGNGNARPANGNGNGAVVRRRGAYRPDAPAGKPPRVGERTGGQSRRGTGGTGGRNALEPLIGVGAFDLNPPTFNGTGHYNLTNAADNANLTGGNGLTRGTVPYIYQATGQLPGYREPTVGDYRFYREASAVPTVALAMAVIAGPILSSSWSYEGDEDTPDERVEFIREVFDPMRTPLVGEMVRAVAFGWRPFEKVFELRDFAGLGQLVSLRKVKPLLPDYTRIVVEKATGAFDGLVQDFSTTNPNRVVLPANKSFVFTYDGEAGDFYGRSRHENIRRILTNYQDATELAGKLGTKVSSIIPIVKFPQGESQTNDPDEITKQTETNRRLAAALVENLTIARGVAFETESFDIADLRANPKLAELTKWAIETVDIGSSATGLASLISEREYFDKLLLRGWLVPERAAIEGTHGTLAEAEAHADIALTDSQLIHNDIVRYINWYLVDELLALNFGEEARGTVWISPSPIVDTSKAHVKALFDAMLANPATMELVMSETDRGAVYEQLEIPADASGGMDPENQDPEENAAAIADVFAKARGDQFKQQQIDQKAADKEDAIAASASFAAALWLGDHYEEIAADPALILNCGTGAGGFKPGNTCAIGSGEHRMRRVREISDAANRERRALTEQELLEMESLSREPVAADPAGRPAVTPARYAKGKVAVRIPASDSGFKTRGAHLADALGAKWSNRERAYIMSPARAEKLVTMYDEGWDATTFNREFIPPQGMDAEAVAKRLSRERKRPVRLSLSNCGTGAGGFKVGNTCARGDVPALPEKAAGYFNIDPAYIRAKYGADVRVQHVQVATLEVSHTKPQKIANAIPQMRAAFEGDGDKRDPIIVIRDASGKMTVHDGNSTVAVAKQQGWVKIPALVANSEARAVDLSAKKASPHPQDVIADAVVDDAIGKIENFSEKPVHPHKTEDAVFSQAAETKPKYDAFVDTGEGISQAIGASVYRVNSKADFKAVLRDAENGPPGPMVVLAGLKGKKRAVEKVMSKFGGDYSRLTDVVRGSIVVDDVSQLDRVMGEIRQQAQKQGWRVSEVENRFKNPTAAGYRDMALRVTAPNGHVTELQVNTKAMLVAKETKGHAMYEEARAIDAKAGLEKRPLTPEESTRIETLNAQMRDLYAKAWTASRRRRK
jgi:hypothetical protein